MTNGVDVELFGETGINRQANIRKTLAIEGKFVAMYLGAHGKYNSLDTIVKAAIQLKAYNKIIFLFVGDGEQKKHLEQLVFEEKLDNVVFHPPIKRRDAPAMLSAANCFLLPNLSGDFFKGNLPNKVFDFLAASRPIIVAGRVESANLVKKIGAGFVVDAEDPDQLAAEIKMVSELPVKERNVIGKRGGEYVRSQFNRKHQADKVEAILSGASC